MNSHFIKPISYHSLLPFFHNYKQCCGKQLCKYIFLFFVQLVPQDRFLEEESLDQHICFNFFWKRPKAAWSRVSWIKGTSHLQKKSVSSFCCCCWVSQSCPTLCDPRGLQHARLPWPSPSPGVWSNSCPLSQWCLKNGRGFRRLAGLNGCELLSQGTLGVQAWQKGNRPLGQGLCTRNEHQLSRQCHLVATWPVASIWKSLWFSFLRGRRAMILPRWQWGLKKSRYAECHGWGTTVYMSPPASSCFIFLTCLTVGS